MGTLSLNIEPLQKFSKKAVPQALHKALAKIFPCVPRKSVWLVGGTALAGFYAEHRRSDDLDLFTNDAGFEPCILAAKSLLEDGATFENETRSPLYYHAFCVYHRHKFTIDVVKDPHLHRAGTPRESSEGFCFASLETLFGMKASALISRCSEKDLYDLKWIIEQAPLVTVEDLIREGLRFDGGISAETLLIGLSGAHLRAEACHFSLPSDQEDPKNILKKIEFFRKSLIKDLRQWEKQSPLSPVAIALKENLKDFK